MNNKTEQPHSEAERWTNEQLENERKRKSNTELVTEFMTFQSPLNQVFVIDAISKLARKIVEKEDKVLESMKDGFVDGNAWVQCAKDWLVEVEKRNSIK